MRPKRHIPYWFVISYVNSDGQVITFTVKATLFYDGACVFSLAPFWKAMVAPLDKHLRVGAELARHRAALTVVLRRLGHTFEMQFPMSRRQLRARGRESTDKTRDVISCRTYGLIVLFSWFANERRSLKAKLSAQHVSRAFFTATIDGDFRGAALLDAALSNEETCEQKGDLRTCRHIQELRRSVFAELCSSAYCTDACVKLMRLMVVCPCCQTACQRFMEAVAEQVDAGFPEREFSSEPLDNEGKHPRE